HPDPSRLSTTSGAHDLSARGLATKRAAVSTGPPAGKGTTKLTARLGQSSAAWVTGVQPKALKPKVTAAAAPNQRRRAFLNVMLILHRFFVQINQTKLSQYLIGMLTQPWPRLAVFDRRLAIAARAGRGGSVARRGEVALPP